MFLVCACGTEQELDGMYEFSDMAMPTMDLDWGERRFTMVCSSCDKKSSLVMAGGSVTGDYRDAEWLREQYCDNSRSMADIGLECNVTPMTIYNWLKRHGIESRSK